LTIENAGALPRGGEFLKKNKTERIMYIMTGKTN